MSKRKRKADKKLKSPRKRTKTRTKNLSKTKRVSKHRDQSEIDADRARYSENLLGRLRLKLFEEIGDGLAIPSAEDQRHFVLSTYRSNPAIGDIYRDVLWLQTLHCVQIDDLNAPDSVEDLLTRLEVEPLDACEFVEVQGVPSSSEPFGVLIQRDGLKPSGYVYAVTIIGESGFPNAALGRLEVRACKELPKPPFSKLGEDGFQRFGVDEVASDWMVRFTVSVLSYVAKTTGLQSIDLDKIKVPSKLMPPNDGHLLQLILGAHGGKVKCARAILPIQLVKPYSHDFCLRIPPAIIRNWADQILRRPSPHTRILVYWDGESFIMNDDYLVYLAFRRLDRTEIPVVIIGDIPDFVTPTDVGGAELLPPAAVSSIPEKPSGRPPNLDDQLIEKHAKDSRSDLNPLISHMYAVSIILSRIVHDPNSKEADVHDFLKENPVVIDPAGFGVRSEVSLGKEYRVDLIVQYPNADRQILLIELESPAKSLFTKNGRPRAYMTHAIQQVEDWLRWWRENPIQIPDGLDGSLVPAGLVVIGKAKDLSEEENRRLIHLNANRLVKVVTYDDLLKRVEGVIRQLEKILG